MDINILSYYLFRDYPLVTQNFNNYIKEHGFIYIGMPTVYEIRSGLKFKRGIQKFNQFEIFIKQHRVLEITIESTEIASDIYASLRKKETIIGENDIYLARIAIENQLAICTNNIKHFKDTQNLDIINWTQ